MKYRICIEFTFESDREIEESTVTGAGSLIESAIVNLPSPDDADTDLRGTVSVRRVLSGPVSGTPCSG